VLNRQLKSNFCIFKNGKSWSKLKFQKTQVCTTMTTHCTRILVYSTLLLLSLQSMNSPNKCMIVISSPNRQRVGWGIISIFQYLTSSVNVVWFCLCHLRGQISTWASCTYTPMSLFFTCGVMQKFYKKCQWNYLLSILLTQPCDTCSCLLISHGLTPSIAICRIWIRRLSGRGRPFVNTRPYWLIFLLPVIS